MIQEVYTDRYVPAHIPDKFEAGTPPIAQTYGLHAAIDFVENAGWDAIQTHETELLTYALKKLSELDFIEVLGPKDSAKINSCISFVSWLNADRSALLHPHDLTEYIGRKGICLRAGHHCTQPLHDHLGHPATSRMSFGVYNSKENIDAACKAIQEAYEFFN